VTPTPEQAAIIEAATQPQSLMVNALAGTGKTTTLTMLAKALPKRPALALAFNKKIKEELEKRFPPNFTVMTMNGLGHRAWSFTINQKKMFIDANKIGRLTNEALKDFPESKSEWGNIRALVVLAMQRGLVPSRFEHAKGLIPDTPDTWLDLDDEFDLGLSSDERKLARRILINSIDEGLKGCISYDDQIYLPVVFSGAFPRFETVLVDEAQDLSPLNHQMLKRVAAGKLIVVGDPRQAIYAFRGADHNSMDNLKSLKSEWIELPLNTTFRCPQSVVERQHDHTPDYVAAPSNPKGAVIDLTGHDAWNWKKILRMSKGSTAILCRNNAPLLSMAFKLLRQNIGVTMMGREIGKGLSNLCKKLAPDQSLAIADFTLLLNDWFERELSKAEANKDAVKIDTVTDRYECIKAVLANKNPNNVKELIFELDNLFAKDSGLVTLATGHKAKGLEWDTVIHLDPWRIPSKWAKKPSEITQENNLCYVLETRTKHTLILANLSTFEA
jgi:superfamily I DNA/RNA helicase